VEKNNFMELEEFLVKAKNNSYANNKKEANVLIDGCKEFIFKDFEWFYCDRYFGFNPFIGEEIVYKNDVPFWGMNYHGSILSKNIDAKELYEFLKKSMRQIKIEKPFRGPNYFKEGEWEYRNNNNGSIDKFDGLEEIYFQEDKVYELKYAGGFIK